MHAPSAFFAWTCSRSRNDLLEICSYLQGPQRARSRLVLPFFFFFFFFFFCRSHNESGLNPLPPIWKFFRLSAMCELLRWPLIAFLRKSGLFCAHKPPPPKKKKIYIWQLQLGAPCPKYSHTIAACRPGPYNILQMYVHHPCKSDKPVACAHVSMFSLQSSESCILKKWAHWAPC